MRWTDSCMHLAACICVILMLACKDASQPSEAANASMPAFDTVSTAYLHPPPGTGGWIRVVGAAINGKVIAIADNGGSIVALYSRDGRLLATLGGRGEGPGEFSSIAWIQATTDGFAVGDGVQSRVTWIGSDGAIQSSRALAQSKYRPLAVTANMGIIASTMRAPGTQPSMREGIQSDSMPLLLFRSDTSIEEPRELGFIRSAEYVQRFEGPRRSVVIAALGRPAGSVSVVDDEVLVFDPLTEEVYWLSLDGSLQGRIRVDRIGKPLSAEDLTSFRQQLAADLGTENGAILLDGVSVGTRLPAFGWAGVRSVPVVTIGGDGTPWLLLYGGLSKAAPEYVLVESGQDQPRNVAGRQGRTLLALADTLAVLVARDSLGLERIEVVRLADVVVVE